MGIEPTYAAWEAAVLPLNYTRNRSAYIASMDCLEATVRRHSDPVSLGLRWRRAEPVAQAEERRMSRCAGPAKAANNP